MLWGSLEGRGVWRRMDACICMVETLLCSPEIITTLLICCVRACVCVLSCISRIWLFATLWTVAHRAPLSTGFSRQEYWSGSPCPPPGEIPNPGIKPESLMSPTLAGRFFTTGATWEAHVNGNTVQYSQTFWHQGPTLWKTIFPCTRVGRCWND